MTFLMAIVSIVIVYPIIYFLPFGLKAKQKSLLLIISLLISLVGILSKNVFSSWQIVLLMFALISLSTILISKRMVIDNDPQKMTQDMISARVQESVSPYLHIDEEEELVDETLFFQKNNADEKQDINFNEHELEYEDIFPPVAAALSEDEINAQDELTLIEQSYFLMDELESESYRTDSTEFEVDLDEINIDYKKELDKDDSETNESYYLAEIEKLMEEEWQSEPIKPDETQPKLKEIKLEKLY